MPESSYWVVTSREVVGTDGGVFSVIGVFDSHALALTALVEPALGRYESRELKEFTLNKVNP